MLPAGWRAVEAAEADGRGEVAYAGPSPEAEVPADLEPLPSPLTRQPRRCSTLTQDQLLRLLIYCLGAGEASRDP